MATATGGDHMDDMRSNKRRWTYERFSGALAKGDFEAARALVNVDVFTAVLPGTSVLSFDDFIAEFRRQRTAFPDLGQDVRVHTMAETDHAFFVHYTMTVHHNGPLTSWDGRRLQATGKTVIIPGVDVLLFDTGGRITKLTIMSDRLDVVEQLTS